MSQRSHPPGHHAGASPSAAAHPPVAQRPPARRRALLLGLPLAGLAAACTSLPDKPVQAQLYDFGPPRALADTPAPVGAGRTAWVLAEVDATGAWDGTAMHYRLAYADAHALRAYALARWAMPPAQLLRQALRARLAGPRPLLNAADAAALPRDVDLTVVRLELVEFSQVFDAPERSSAVVRVQATATRRAAQAVAEALLGQRTIEMRAPARSADAAGGAQALAVASDQVALEIERWLQSLR